MAYRIKLNEPFGKAVLRIIGEQIAQALQRLGDASDPEVSVHEARKHLKRIRALLRLARPVLGEETFAQENARFREIARSLSATRDFDVLAQTIVFLEAADDAPLRTASRQIKTSLAADRKNAEALGLAEAEAKARTMLEEAQAGLAQLELPSGRFELIRPGLHKTYRASQRRFKEAYAALSDEAFHEWRKTVQHHWRQMVLLTRAWPEAMAARIGAARELSEILGHGQDLALLKRYVQSAETLKLSSRGRQEVMQRCNQLQLELREQAEPRGERLLAETATDFCSRIEVYWHSAREMKNAGVGNIEPHHTMVASACGAETGGRKRG